MVHHLIVDRSAPVPDARWRDVVALIVGRRRRFRVSGPSMEPTLADGDVVLVDPGRAPAMGDVVCVHHPHRPTLTIVKRVDFVDEFGRAYLTSDNRNAPDASDSRSFGAVASELVVGRVTARLRRRGD